MQKRESFGLSWSSGEEVFIGRTVVFTAITANSPCFRTADILVKLGIPGRVSKAAEIGSKRFPIFCRLAITSALRRLPISGSLPV
jgi:hypothetical protein